MYKQNFVHLCEVPWEHEGRHGGHSGCVIRNPYSSIADINLKHTRYQRDWLRTNNNNHMYCRFDMRLQTPNQHNGQLLVIWCILLIFFL